MGMNMQNPGMQLDHDGRRYIEDPGAMMLEHASLYTWVQPVIMIFSIWLMTSWSISEYGSRALLLSDIISGFVSFIIAAVAVKFSKNSWLTYANAFVGVWLLLAPLFFWAPSSALYVIDKESVCLMSMEGSRL